MQPVPDIDNAKSFPMGRQVMWLSTMLRGYPFLNPVVFWFLRGKLTRIMLNISQCYKQPTVHNVTYSATSNPCFPRYMRCWLIASHSAIRSTTSPNQVQHFGLKMQKPNLCNWWISDILGNRWQSFRKPCVSHYGRSAASALHVYIYQLDHS